MNSIDRTPDNSDELSSLSMVVEDKEFISKFMTKSGQTIFKPALAKDIFSKDDFVNDKS